MKRMKQKILVIDDESINLRIADVILSQADYVVTQASSGMEGLKILQTEKIDLVLLDIEMPIMNGIRTLEKMKEDPKMADIPVVFLTALADTDNVMQAGKLGAVDYIKKPFLPQELLARVDKFFA